MHPLIQDAATEVLHLENQLLNIEVTPLTLNFFLLHCLEQKETLKK